MALGNKTDLKALKNKKTAQSVPRSGLKSLNELRRGGLLYGVMNGLNIIYDTTLTSTTNIIKRDIMPVLEINKEVIKYLHKY